MAAMSVLAILATAPLAAPGWRLAVAALCIGQAAACVGLAVLAMYCVVRPLAETERSAALLSRGELQRPVVVSAAATAELRELQLAWEEMRRALVTKLRSSTELNLQLESEVARRSAELSRRNTELSEALERLRTTRDELVRTEKLAAVGRIAASVTSAISEPIANLAAMPAPLQQKFAAVTEQIYQIGQLGQQKPAAASALAALGEMDGLLDGLLASALRVRDIVRAMRVYARPQDPPQDPSQDPLGEANQAQTALPDPALEDVLRLLRG